MMQGGWDYIAAAYALTYGTLLSYALILWRRYRRRDRLLAQPTEDACEP